MASIGHIAVGIASARAFTKNDAPRGALLKAVVAFCMLAMLPDVDVVAFALGIPYEHPWGHRGVTHSFVFALIITALVFGLAKPLKLPAVPLALATLASIGTHAILDTLTNGGLGCELFWPFSTERYFAPWTPIPVAPIGMGMLSLRGFLVVVIELVMFSPLLIYATFPRKQ